MSRSSFTRLVALVFFLGVGAFALPAAADDGSPGVVNINTATKEQLRLLPGIGDKKADRIIVVRAKRPFETPEQIRRVKGIGRGIFRKLKPYLSVTGPTTLTTKPHLTRNPSKTKAQRQSADDNDLSNPDGPRAPVPT